MNTTTASKEKMYQDSLNIKQWADNKANEYRIMIKKYIADGLDKNTALDLVLEHSTLGAGYKGQIRYEFR